MKPKGATSAREAIEAIDALLEVCGELSPEDVAALHRHGASIPAEFLQQLRAMRKAIRERMSNGRPEEVR